MAHIEAKETTRINIINMVGITVAIQQLNKGSNVVDLSQLSTGIYLIYPESGEAVKLVKE